MLHVDTGAVEVGEVHHRDQVEVAVEVTGVVPPGQGEQLGDLAERFERVSEALLVVDRHVVGPSDRNHLAEHHATLLARGG